MPRHQQLRTCILSQGSEILDGSIQNTNARWLSTYFAQSQYVVVEHLTVGDDVEHLTRAFQRLASEYDVVISTGGIGPTDDDLTNEVLASTFNKPLTSHPTALENLKAHYEKRNRTMSNNALKMTVLPQGAIYIDNPLGAACGYQLNVEECSIFVFPGVPIELHPMVPLAFPTVSRQNTPLVFGMVGISESRIVERLSNISLPPHAFHATRRGNWLTLYPDVTERETLQNTITAQLSEFIFDLHDRKRSIVEVVAEELWARDEMIATAESCTAGKLSSWFTSISGSSAYYKEGAIVYSNEAKNKYCGVSMHLINTEGAVCKQVALDLAQGIQERSGATWGMGITGIAGPGGGTLDKPVGTVHIAVYGHGKGYHAHCVFNGTRDQVTDQACATVVMMLLKAIQEHSL